jgi:hypothetical protein
MFFLLIFGDLRGIYKSIVLDHRDVNLGRRNVFFVLFGSLRRATTYHKVEGLLRFYLCLEILDKGLEVKGRVLGNGARGSEVLLI